MHIATNKRQRACGRFASDPAGVTLSRYPIPTENLALEGQNPDPWRARYRGLRLCDLIWTCPVCGPRLRQERAGDVDLAARTWLERQGAGSVLFLTLTVPHDYGEELGEVLGDVKAGWGRIIGGRGWQRLKRLYGIRHYIRSHDLTVGRAGFHPHLHTLLFLSAPLDGAALLRLRGELWLRWAEAISDRGRRTPTLAHGIGLEAVKAAGDVAAYVVQLTGDGAEVRRGVASEVTRGDLKTSRHTGQRTPWQVLGDYHARPNRADLELWRAYEKGTRGLHAIQWSRGLRLAVDLVKPAGTPALELEPGEETVWRFHTVNAWAPVAFRRGRMSDLLNVAAARGEIGVYIALAAWRRADGLAGRQAGEEERRAHLLAQMGADFAAEERLAYSLPYAEAAQVRGRALARWWRALGFGSLGAHPQPGGTGVTSATAGPGGNVRQGIRPS